MGEHVHVHIGDGVRVSDDGELVELSRCRCGATRAKTYRAADGAPEE